MNSFIFDDFEQAAHAALGYLQQRLDFGLWMVTRTEGDDWIVLHTEDRDYGVAPGQVFNWADSFCYEMVQGRGPRVAPDASRVSVYSEAQIARQVRIQSYIGVPIYRQGGELFGTLCAIDPQRKPEQIVQDQALVELMARFLSTVLHAEQQRADLAREAERFKNEALRDALTGVYNRRGWQQMLNQEAPRCRQLGSPAAILILDLKDLKPLNEAQGYAAGDALLRRTVQVLQQTVPAAHIVARLGGGEFGILAVESNRQQTELLAIRLKTALAKAGLSAALGIAQHSPFARFEQTWQLADERMYRDTQRLASASQAVSVLKAD